MNTYLVTYQYTHVDEVSGAVKLKKTQVLVQAADVIDCAATVHEINDQDMEITNMQKQPNVSHIDRILVKKREKDEEYNYWKIQVEIPNEEGSPSKETMFLYAKDSQEANKLANGEVSQDRMILNYRITLVQETKIECALKSINSIVTTLEHETEDAEV
jgi:hypothetical protein